MTVWNYLQKRPFGNHDPAPAVGAIVNRLNPPSALIAIVRYAHLAERPVCPAYGAGEMTRLQTMDVFARAGVNQVRKHAQRILIGKRHLIGNRFLDDAAD